MPLQMAGRLILRKQVRGFLDSTCPSTEIYKIYMSPDKLQHVRTLCDSDSQHPHGQSFLGCSSAHRDLLHVWVVLFSGGVFYLPSVQLYRISRHARVLYHIWQLICGGQGIIPRNKLGLTKYPFAPSINQGLRIMHSLAYSWQLPSRSLFRFLFCDRETMFETYSSGFLACSSFSCSVLHSAYGVRERVPCCVVGTAVKSPEVLLTMYTAPLVPSFI